MANLHLTLATGDYDHLRDFTSGEIKRTLDAFLKFAREQGVCSRLLKVEELFPASVAHQFRM